MGALYRRELTGEGERVELGMLDSALPWLTKQAGKAFVGEEPKKMGTKDPVLAPYQVYPTADGHLSVGAANQKLWTELCDAVDRPDLVEDPRFESNADRVEHMDELEAELSETFRQRPTDEWVELLADERGLPVGPVYNVDAALHNEQIDARGMVSTVDHPAAGEIPAIEHPLDFANAESGFDEAPPLLGEDTEPILRDLGYSDADLETLRAAGAIPDE
jgi:crotonobetainyl-CoA:carnitine CoA-transferase CaiB-like acyl-CoA transferase